MKTTATKLLAISTLFIALSASSFAANITIYGTGQANSGSSQADPNYQLVGAPVGVTLGPAYTTPAFGPWQTPPPGLYWDNPFNPFGYGPSGRYDYQTTFDLTGLSPSSAVLTGLTGSDDAGEIWLNGVMVGTMGSISTFSPFTITDGLNGAHFQSGVNSLDFMVDNTFVYQMSPTGLMVQISGTADAVPEPASLTLLGSGIVGVAALLRRRIG